MKKRGATDNGLRDVTRVSCFYSGNFATSISFQNVQLLLRYCVPSVCKIHRFESQKTHNVEFHM